MMSLNKKVAGARARFTRWLLDKELLAGHRDYTRYIILGMGRTGSNLLATSLQSQSNVIAFGELFNNAHHERISWMYPGYKTSGAALELRARDPRAFIDTMVYGRMPKRVSAVGFKLFYYHAREPNWACIWPHLGDMEGLKVIHLKRQNLLRTYLSMSYALQDRQWIARSDRGVTRKEAIELVYEDVLKGFRKIRAWENEGDRFFSGQPVLEVFYEGLVGRYDEEMSRIQDFLGVPRSSAHANTRKQSIQRLSESIANYEELKARFQGSEWAAFFEE